MLDRFEEKAKQIVRPLITDDWLEFMRLVHSTSEKVALEIAVENLKTENGNLYIDQDKLELNRIAITEIEKRLKTIASFV